MIKIMEGDNVRIQRVTAELVRLNVKGEMAVTLTADELNELIQVTRTYFDTNDMWQVTNEAKLHSLQRVHTLTSDATE